MSFSTAILPRYGVFAELADQTGSTTVPTAIKFGTNVISTQGVTVVTDGSELTRVTFAAAGVYFIAGGVQCNNSTAADHTITIWMRVNGTDAPNTAIRDVVPKVGDGGVATVPFNFARTIAANDYVQIMWLVDNVGLTLDYNAAVVGPPAYPARPSARIAANRISS